MADIVTKTSIEGLLIIERPTFEDARGFFREACKVSDIPYDFNPLQWNHSLSLPNVLRGIHAENWNKLIYPVTGEIFVAIVDIRPESPTFGKVETITINSANPKLLFIKKGLANSFCVTSSVPVNYFYLVDAYYDGTDTKAIAWDDPDLNIAWPIKNPILSERDRNNPTLRKLIPERF